MHDVKEGIYTVGTHLGKIFLELQLSTKSTTMYYHLSQGSVNFWNLLESNFTKGISVMPFNLTLNRLDINPDYTELEEMFVRSDILRP